MVKLDELKDGDTVTLDGGFTCLDAGNHIVLVDDIGPSVECSHGLHYLEGQKNVDGTLIGVVAHFPTSSRK